jgi:hypothetical protein
VPATSNPPVVTWRAIGRQRDGRQPDPERRQVPTSYQDSSPPAISLSSSIDLL